MRTPSQADQAFTASTFSDHHTERPDLPFFWYTNRAGKLASFRTDHLLHVVEYGPDNSSIVDFLNSYRGFYLRPVKEFIDEKQDEEPVNTLVLMRATDVTASSPWSSRGGTGRTRVRKCESIMGELALTLRSPLLVDDPLQTAL